MFKKIRTIRKRDIFLSIFAFGMLSVSGGLLWASTLAIPDISAFETREVVESTKIYDRTGEVLLYDAHEDIRRTVIEADEMSEHIREATIAIEDQEFFEHIGIDFSAIMRATMVNLKDMEFSQGGSTITQQVIKNSLLTNDKKISRKVKEWILALKLENIYDKEEILTLYLNEIPYGGTIYGIEEAAQAFFDKPASDLNIAESAYLASLPQAPSYYLNHPEELETRKNVTLSHMLDSGFITEEEYEEAKEADVDFNGIAGTGIKAPHFVFYVLEQLEEKYDKETVRNGGLKIVTTLDYELQEEMQQMVHDYIIEHQEQFDMENAGVVVTDPNTGQILVMIGSRKYDDPAIDGAVNVTTSLRQPGSTFKPFAYATAFTKGYTPESIIFDLRTQFSTACQPFETTVKEYPCFSPENYDFAYRGPVTMREALAASMNVPAVKALYLAGVRNTIQTAQDMGVDTLDANQDANLSIVLGSGEVRLLDMTNAYGVFANGGTYHEPASIISVEDQNGNTLEEFEENGERVLPEQSALQITDILSDRGLRVGTFGPGTALDIPSPDIAVKTGTTNNYVDVWTIGYNTDMTLGIWGGNNDNSPIVRRVSTYVIAPLWRDLLDVVAEKYPGDTFEEPNKDYSYINKPILTGSHTGGVISGNRIINRGIHSILYWTNPANPLGPVPSNPNVDPQYPYWEYPVSRWSGGQNINLGDEEIESDEENSSSFEVDGLESEYEQGEEVEFEIEEGSIEIEEVEASIDDEEDSDSSNPFEISLDTDNLEAGSHTLSITVFGEDNERLVRNFQVEINN